MNPRQIDKIKITEESATITWTETITTKTDDQEQVNKLTHTVEGNFIPHPDFVNALKRLRKRLLGICEFNDYDHMEKYAITGLTFSGEQDSAKVIITASKKVEWSGKVFTFNTPLTPLFDQEEYADSKALDKECKKVVEEAWAYIDENKHAEPPQLELAFKEE